MRDCHSCFLAEKRLDRANCAAYPPFCEAYPSETRLHAATDRCIYDATSLDFLLAFVSFDKDHGGRT
jgi:hypothetical protein